MRVEIWSDVICPWCYIGKRRFEEALRRWDGAGDVEVVYRPYQLDPRAAPGATTPVREAYARKFGGYERADQIIGHLTDLAAAEGLEFRLDRAQRANTLLAHRLLWLAEHDLGPTDQAALKERLLQAYFVDGDNVGDPDTLARLAESCGLQEARVREVLDGDLGVAEVVADLDRAHHLGITAVPTFVFDDRWTVPGAQDADVFVNVLERVRSLQAAEAAAETAAAGATDEVAAASAAEGAARGAVCVDDTCEV